MGEFVPYQDKVNFNVLHYPPVSQVMEALPQEGQPERTIAICRCWQSKKFPYCDNSHKPMVLEGDNVGPYVAVLRNRGHTKQLAQQEQQRQQLHQQQQQRAGARTNLTKAARLGKGFLPLTAGVVAGGVFGFAASELLLRTLKGGVATKEELPQRAAALPSLLAI